MNREDRGDSLHQKLIPCLCGCGELITAINRNGLKTGYKHGHNYKGIREEKHPQWKGGRIERDGYVLLLMYGNRLADCRGYVKEHRLIWEQANNACLLSWGDVHHKNGKRNDNRPENLEAMMKGIHSIIHLKERNFNIGKRIYHKKQN